MNDKSLPVMRLIALVVCVIGILGAIGGVNRGLIPLPTSVPDCQAGDYSVIYPGAGLEMHRACFDGEVVWIISDNKGGLVTYKP